MKRVLMLAIEILDLFFWGLIGAISGLSLLLFIELLESIPQQTVFAEDFTSPLYVRATRPLPSGALPDLEPFSTYVFSFEED